MTNSETTKSEKNTVNIKLDKYIIRNKSVYRKLETESKYESTT